MKKIGPILLINTIHSSTLSLNFGRQMGDQTSLWRMDELDVKKLINSNKSDGCRALSFGLRTENEAENKTSYVLSSRRLKMY